MEAKAVSQSYRENRIMGSIYFPFHALSLLRTQWKRNVGQYNQKYNTIPQLNQSPNKKYNYELLTKMNFSLVVLHKEPQAILALTWQRVNKRVNKRVNNRVDILSYRMTWLFSND